MSEVFETYCIDCDKPVSAEILSTTETLQVKGESVQYDCMHLICPDCGAIIGDSRIESDNLKNAYAIYCKNHGLMSSDEIRSLRERYGLSVREFSRFLGLGEQTVARFESGSIPGKTSNSLLEMAKSTEGAEQLLERNADSLSKNSVAKVEDFISAEERSRSRFLINPQWIRQAMESEPSSRNGFRTLDMERVAALATIFANRCPGLYKTKIQKAFFFADHLNYERTSRSLTGMTYAHAPFGPIMYNMDEVLMSLKQNGYIETVEDEFGDIIRPLTSPTDCFTADELELIDEIVEFVNSFNTVKAISDYSHELDAWKNTDDGNTIEYGMGFGQVEDAVQARSVA